MIKVKINNKEVIVEEGSTILRACQEANVEIPVFCYHEKLSIAGNCRMCLVEVDGIAKPVASCAMPVREEMEIFTNTPLIRDSRKSNLEFLLINHPLDCPVCDEAGECDLQDITMSYGPSLGRFTENKRAIADKNLGPLIKTQMNRCIHCTRCIRFLQEVAGTSDIVAIGRGENTEVTTYLDTAVRSELSGNLVDICPVGALTSKPYAFKARSWELKHTETIDVLDAVGSHIRVDTRGDQVLRILPRTCEHVNEEWISDKARYAFDGLFVQRLDRPYIRKDGQLMPASWDEALSLVAEKLLSISPDKVAAIGGDLADVESMLLLKELMHSLGVYNLDCRQDGAFIPYQNRSDYLFNTTIQNIEQADACLIIGSNIRWEAPLLNTRLRRAYYNHNLKVGYIGPKIDLTYPYEYLGEKASILNQFWRNKSSFLNILRNAKKPMIILGMGTLQAQEGERIYNIVRTISEREGVIKSGWNGFNILHAAANRVGGLDVGFIPRNGALGTKEIIDNRDMKFVYLLNADEINMKAFSKAFVVYQGHHGDAGANRADVVLPGASYMEKSATYVNLEGRVQQTKKVLETLNLAKEDWKIIRKLSDYLNRPLPYNTQAQIMEKLATIHKAYTCIGDIVPTAWQSSTSEMPKEIVCGEFDLPIKNYYMTDPISRNSQIMAQCRKEVLKLEV